MSPQNLLRSVLLGGLFCGLLPSLNLNANFGWQFLEQHRGPPREFVEQHYKCRPESPTSPLMFSIAACRETSLATELRECFWDSRWGETDYVH